MVKGGSRVRVDHDREVTKKLTYNNLLEMLNLTHQAT